MRKELMLAIIAPLFLSSCNEEDKKWKEFKSEHNCRIVGKIDKSTSFTSGGHLAFNEAKDGWLCDDGITYWKDHDYKNWVREGW